MKEYIKIYFYMGAGGPVKRFTRFTRFSMCMIFKAFYQVNLSGADLEVHLWGNGCGKERNLRALRGHES